MYFNINKAMNLMIIAALTLVIIIMLIVIVKISDRTNRYKTGTDMHDTYDPYLPWEKAH
jgi:heme/copper-type cytochrome/quinol oxidase subunit 2